MDSPVVRPEDGAAARPLAVITGASAGIGAALARLFAANGYDLLVLARRMNRLEALKQELEGLHSTVVQCLEVDLSDISCVERIADTVGGRPVSVLVNNAGIMVPGQFSESDAGAVSDMLTVNVVTTAMLTRQLLPSMVGHGQGRVLIVSSMAGFLPIAKDSVYAATKAFCNSFSQALGLELKKSGVSVTVLCPGLTDTDMVSYSMEGSSGLLSRIKKLLLTSAEQVAEVGYRGCMERKSVVVPGVLNKVFSVLYQMLPLPLARLVGGTIGRYFF